MKPNIVLLHGWASHPQVWRVLSRHLEKFARVQAPALPGYDIEHTCVPHTLEHIADTLAHAAPGRCTVLGWSLGAQVALTWARRQPAQVERLVLIAGTPCFMQRTGWEHGVSPHTLRQFASALEREPETLLRRFVALQAKGDSQAVRVAHQLRTALFTHKPPQGEALRGGLALLRAVDMRGQLPSIVQPALVLHGEKDAVTPLASGRYLAQQLPHGCFEAIVDSGHAPFISSVDRVAELIRGFLHD